MKHLLSLVACLLMGCSAVISTIEYPDYIRAREARKHKPTPTTILDPYQTTTQP